MRVLWSPDSNSEHVRLLGHWMVAPIDDSLTQWLSAASRRPGQPKKRTAATLTFARQMLYRAAVANNIVGHELGDVWWLNHGHYPNCNPLYHAIKADAGPETIDSEIACHVCDGPGPRILFTDDGHTRQCVGFTLIHLLVSAAIHPPTTRRQGNATVWAPSFSMTANSRSPAYGAVDIGFQFTTKPNLPLADHPALWSRSFPQKRP